MNNIKPAIIAICGAAASGKDTLLNALAPRLGATRIVSDTTRPPREGEKDGVSYNFITEDEFDKRIVYGQYLELSRFRGWLYGTNKDTVCGKVNIGVFNMDGIFSLMDYKNKYNIIPIYLQTSPITRIKRYIKRDKRFTFECVRRFFTDLKQFYAADIYISMAYPQYLVLKNFSTTKDLDKLTQYLVRDVLSDYYH